MRVGVLGGTFDPIHLGHTALATGVRAWADLDRVLLIPAAQPPHRGAAVASAQDRLAMCRLATASLDGVEVSDLEVRRGGPSYTLDTLLQLEREFPGAQLRLILGWDAAQELRSWREPDRVLALAELIVVSRPGLGSPRSADLAAAGLDPGQVRLCPVLTPDVTATKVRARAAGAESLAGLIDARVEAYLTEHRLYTTPSPEVHNQGVE